MAKPSFDEFVKNYGNSGSSSGSGQSKSSGSSGNGSGGNRESFSSFVKNFGTDDYAGQSYQNRVLSVIQRISDATYARDGDWTQDASGGNMDTIKYLLDEYDRYEGDKSSMHPYRDTLYQFDKNIQRINRYFSQFNSQEDYDRNRSGYINYGVGYTPQNWNLTDDDARAIRTQQAKADQEAASQAKAEYEAADSAFRKINNAYAMATNNRYAGTYDEEKSKALYDEYLAAKDRMQQAKTAYDDIQNRLDAYNAGWGKVDQYADVLTASKGTKGSYQGPGYEELNAWNSGRQQDMLDQQMAAFRDDAPPAQGSSPDNMPAVNDKLGFWLSLTPEQREEEVFTSGNAKHWGNLTEGEISAYYYLIQNRGQEAADKYLEDMTAELGRREDAKFVEKVENANGLALAGYNALSVAENVLGALPSAAEKAGELITGKDNPYSNVQGLQRRAQYIRGETGQRIDDAFSDSQWLQDKVGEQWANRVGNVVNQTYQAMMSGVDSAAGAMLFGPGTGFGVGPFTMHLGGYSTVMGMGAFAQRAQELQAMGASREQMAVGAVGAGILESIFEDISAEAFFGNVLDNPDTAFVKKLLTQMGVEASEEVCTEIGNMALDAINLGRKSDNQRRILEYVASGLSYEDAVREATRDAAMDIFWAGYGGAFSAGGMTAVGHTVSSTASKIDAARSNYYVGSKLYESGDAGALVEQAQVLTDTKARKKLVEQAQRVQKNQAAGNDSFADKMDTGKVANQIAKQAQKEGADAKRSAFQAIARDYLSGRENIGNKKLAEKVLTKAYMGENFLPGGKGYYNILGGEKLLNAVLDSVPAGALESDTEARQQKSARTVIGTLGAVTGSKSVTEFSKTFDSRNDGMSYRKDSHEPVNIRGISKMQGGKLYLQTDSGEVLADNVVYGNYGEAKLFKVISAMDIDTAGAQKVLGMVENTQLETGDFADAMQNAYLDGYTGVEFDRINRSSLAGQLTQEQRSLAWEAGRQARAARVGSMAQTVDSGKMATAKSGLKIADNVDLAHLNGAQESALAFIRALSGSGVPVEVYASTEAERAAGAANGSFAPDGSIRIDINAGDNGQGAAAYALAHEITHFTESYSPEKFQTLADVLIREAGEKGISWENMLEAKTAQLREQEQYAGLEEQKLADLARSECIAEMCETILTDTDAAARVSQQLRQQDKTLWGKIKDFFKGLVERLKSAYKDMDPDSAIARQMKDTIRQSEAIRNAWVDAVSDSVVNFRMQDGQKKNAQEGVRKSDRNTKMFSYAYFEAKQDVEISDINADVGTDRKYIRDAGVKSALQIGKLNQYGSVEVFVDDIGRNVIVGKDGVSHGLRRENKGTPTENYIVAANAGPIIKNSIIVNELTPKKETAADSYALIGIARDQYGTGYVVESIVNKYTFELESMDVLYSMNARKELAALNAPRATLKTLPVTSSDTTIPSVLNLVNEHFPDILPEDVLKNFGYDRRPSGALGESALYSSRTRQDSQIGRLTAQNEKLQQEADYLRQLVQIQKSGNKDFILDRNSVKKQAGKLMASANAKGDTAEFSRMLNDFYHRMHTDSEITWDAMQEDAGAIADWLLEHHQAQRDEYAQSVLDFLKKRRVKLSESQVGDIEYSYGSLSDFKRAIKGSIILDQSANTSLDQLWQEAAAQFPDQFAADAVDADMPDRLADIVRWANSSESSAESEFQYNVAEYRNDLMQKVMEGYWDVEPVTSVSDKLNAKISDLRQKHKAAMQEAKDQNRQAIANERARSKAAIDAYAAQRDAIDKANKALYEAERDQMVQAYSRDMKALESQFGEDSRIMQKEFFRLLREYDKQSAKGEKTGARDAQTIQELRNQLKKEADSHKEDSAAWNREFNRLLREYDASGRQIDRLEAKVKHQQEAAKAKVESRKMTEARYKIERTAKELNRYLLQPTNTVHVPAAMQESVAKAMDALTMAISGRKGGINADRLSEYAYQLRELQKDPSGNAGKIADVQRKIQTLTERDARMHTAMSDLKEQYQALQSSGDPAAAQIYDENVAAWIQDCLDVIGETEYRDMSLQQLESVQRVYRALLRRIQTANKAFREGKQATISEKVGRLTMEMDVKKKKAKTSGKAEKAVDQFFWNNLKPVYAFDRIGSGVMSELYENLRSGEDTWYNDVSAAKAFFLGTADKYGYNTWDNESLMEFESATGQKFQLNLEERMSLYAYSLREQARDHLKKGGIVINENTERVAVGLLGVKRNMIYNDANAYNLTDETITAIGDSLTADQRAFAREMQQYLSTTMGAKGNEISRQLYDIDLFKEQFYWPLVSSKDYSARIKDAGENPAGNKIKNMGAAKPITPGASNPVVLSGFMDTWAGHVNQMSMYHAFTLPMEDFYRVYNWNSGSTENSQTKSTVQMLKDVYGDGATNYIDQFLKDLNGGLRADPRATVGRAMLSRFKKSAVFASASVAIQQPSAIGRAFSVIDPKYFVGSKVENAGESWEQCKKYAPIAGLKEMGRFDMDMGRSTIDYITAREYTGFREKASGFLTDSDYRDEIIGKAPELADQITWCAMWEAAKRQTAAKNPSLRGEALLTQAGKLFTECITRTQVYDSVFSRSANMRSKDTGMAMVTSFMAEPTTSINMIENAVRQWSRGYKMTATKAVTSVLASVVINSALVSMVYAARNKDEDKTYWEKYLASLTGELIEGVNPITYIPYAQDVWNMLQGYDVERSDMSLAADAVKALNKIVKVASKYPADGGEEQQQAWLKALGDACWAGADGVASILGIPEKNIRRDIVAVMNLFKDSNWGESDSGTIKDAIAEAVKDATPIWNQIPDESREAKLYKAIIGGTPAQLHRLQNKYDTPKDLETAVVKALRLKEPRIRQAAEAHAAGDDQTRLRIAKELIAEKHFTQNQVVAAINAEVSRINSEGKTASDKIKEQSLYYTEDYIDAMTAGLGNTDAIRQEIIRAKVANSDKEQEEAIASAERSFMYAVKDTAKDQFLDGDLSMEQTEKILKSVGVYDGDEEDIHRNVYAWQISEELGGKYDWSVSQYLDWKEVIAPSGFFTPDTYDNYLTGVGNVHGEDLNGDGKTDKYSKTKAMARYINSLPLTNEQKDFLFALAYPNIYTQKKYKLW